MADYTGLTRILWPGTWSSLDGSTYPVIIDQDLRGTLQFITGDPGNQLTDISGQRLEEGMLVYVKNGYTSSGIVRSSETYYQYKALPGESRNISGELPNADANWSEFTGSATLDNNLIFTIPSGQPNRRQLIEYKESGITYAVRAADLLGNMFNLTLATFTPTLSGAVTPTPVLNWDVPCSGFFVSVGNPTDFTSQYISSVASTTQTAGVFSALTDFTTTGPSVVPAGGVSWTQTFTTNSIGVIRPFNGSGTIVGGSASATIAFNVTPGGLYSQTIPVAVSWNTPTLSATTTAVGGKTFLEYYTSTTYQINVTNMTNSANYSHAITATGGTATPSTQNTGTITFSPFIYHYNTSVPRYVAVTTTFTRPSTVTGTQYTATLSTTSSTFVSASFTYPSFWLTTANTVPVVVPDQALLISGNSFDTPMVTVLGNQQRTLSTSVTNNSGAPRLFWFGILASAQQPTTFQVSTGGVFSPVSITSNSTQPLYPDSPPGDYVNVTYRLYGFIIQNGVTTFISIS